MMAWLARRLATRPPAACITGRLHAPKESPQMDFPTRFIVSIDRYGIYRRFARVVAGALVAVTALATAPAQGGELAKDLLEAIHAPTTPALKWTRDVNGRRFVQALVLSDSDDPELTDLRAFVVQAGGAVLKHHSATHALTVNVPTSVLHALARRADVVSVAPNRSTHRTASTLETITGTLTSNVRTNSTKTSYSGLDGTGIGIAVVDSGVMKAHDAFLNGLGQKRVQRNVSMLKQTLANWTTGVDSTTSPMPGSFAQIQYENSIANDNNWNQDTFGHGTHIASVAAGRAEVYGAISSPGDDPSVITVGAVNYHNSLSRSVETVDHFSSRGPTRGSYVNASGVTQHDNLLKPDLVAPGNKVVAGAAMTQTLLLFTNWNYLANTYYNYLVAPLNIREMYPQTQMMLSGTSIAAPVVAGSAALLLQANPGLTPPLIKAILQYTAQPLPGFNLLEQGAGLLNVDGAVALAKALRTDVATAIHNGQISAGSPMLAPGMSMPTQSSTVNGTSFNWSRIAFAGGGHIVSKPALFTEYQPIYDPRVTWADGIVRFRQPMYWSGYTIAPNTYVQRFIDKPGSNQTLLTAGVVMADALAGTSDLAAKTGMFIPTGALSGWLIAGSGTTLTQGVVL